MSSVTGVGSGSRRQRARPPAARRRSKATWTSPASFHGSRFRGHALRRALQRAGFSRELRMYGPPQPFAAALDDGWETVDIQPDLLGSPATAAATDLAQRLRAFAPDLLVVDLFWAPLRHILPLPGCECWLLLRSAPPTWLDGPPGARFESMQYTRIASIAPSRRARSRTGSIPWSWSTPRSASRPERYGAASGSTRARGSWGRCTPATRASSPRSRPSRSPARSSYASICGQRARSSPSAGRLGGFVPLAWVAPARGFG